MRKILISMLCASLPLQAMAINKCELDGKITYTETPCANGKQVEIVPPPSNEDVLSAQERATKHKAIAEHLGNARVQRAQKIDKEEQEHQDYVDHRKKCDDLARRKNAVADDAPIAPEDLADPSQTATRRRAIEAYAKECGK